MNIFNDKNGILEEETKSQKQCILDQEYQLTNIKQLYDDLYNIN
jgi:hypothetical protein